MLIIVCSTNKSIRERWDRILSHDHSVYLVESLQALQQLSPQYKREGTIILVDSQFATIDNLRKAWPPETSPKIFYLSVNPSDSEGLMLLRKGAVGYANAYMSETLLPNAISTIQKGRVWVGQKLMLSLIKKSATHQTSTNEINDSPLKKLSVREKEIAVLISEGLPNKAIAEKLYISERTVKSHATSIFSKTGTKSRLELAILIQKHLNKPKTEMSPEETGTNSKYKN